MEYAALSQRVYGQLIDGLVAAGPGFLVVVLPPSVANFYAISWLLWCAFHVLLADGLTGGQSLGKRVIGTRVVSASTGAPCTFTQSFVRNLLLLVLGPIDWIFIFGAHSQRLGDRLAGTIVIPAA